MTEPRNGPTMREYFERLFNDHLTAHREHQSAHDREHVASQKAIDVASTLASQNKDDANEWRDAMTDRERTFARADAVDRVTVEMDRRLGALERANSQMAGALNVARFLGAAAMAVSGALLVWLITRGGV